MGVGFKDALERSLQKTSQQFAVAWDHSIIQNFQSGGRPKWKATRRGGAILQDSGRLKTNTIVRSRQVSRFQHEIVATNKVVYARIHQFGGTIRPRNAKSLAIPLTAEARHKRPSDFGDRLFLHKGKEGKHATLCEAKGKGKNAKVIAHYILLKFVKIPARPFVVVQVEDRELLKTLEATNMIEAKR